MKYFILVFLLLVPLASALTLEGEGYGPGETLVLSVDKGASLSDLKLFLNTTEVKVGFIKIESETATYFYTHLPETLEAGEYILNYQNESVPLVINSSSSLEIKNPVLFLEGTAGEFSVHLLNKDMNLPLTVSVQSNLQPARNLLDLPPGDSRELFVKYNGTAVKELTLLYDGKTRNIVLLQKETAENETSSVENTSANVSAGKVHLFYIDTPQQIKHVVSSTRMIEGGLEFMSDASLQNVRFAATGSLADLLEFNVSNFATVEAQKVYGQYLWINREKNAAPGNYSADIIMTAENAESTTLKLEVEFTEKKEEKSESVPLGEKKVEIIEEPVVTSINLSGNEFKEEEKKNYTAGLIVVGVILVILALIIYKLRPKKKVKQFEEIMKKPSS